MRTCSGPRSCPAVRLPNSLESVPPQRSGERILPIGAGSCGQHFHRDRLLGLFLVCGFIVAQGLFFFKQAGAEPYFVNHLCDTCTNPAPVFCASYTNTFCHFPCRTTQKKPPFSRAVIARATGPRQSVPRPGACPWDKKSRLFRRLFQYLFDYSTLARKSLRRGCSGLSKNSLGAFSSRI